MTEEYKLNVFFHLEQYSSLKLVFVCEENKAELVKEFEETADLIFKEFGKKKITQTLEVCENQMLQKQSTSSIPH